jgi:two-component system response regulator HydG
LPGQSWRISVSSASDEICGIGRELENAVERAMVVGRGQEIRSSDFSFQFQVDEPKGGKTLEDIERAHIERILRETQHNLSRAARILDIDRTTLYNKLRRYGLR